MSGYRRRGRIWFTAMGAMFLIMAAILFARQILLVGPEFVADYLLNGEVTSEKVSAGMAAFGAALAARGVME